MNKVLYGEEGIQIKQFKLASLSQGIFFCSARTILICTVIMDQSIFVYRHQSKEYKKTRAVLHHSVFHTLATAMVC